jgi:hypothetical protein
MPRIRTIKPELWTDELLGSLPIEVRLLFIGLISNADDEGRFRAHPRGVRAAVFPFDDISVEQVDNWLNHLARKGRIVIYDDADGQRYGQVRKFKEHQQINRPTLSRLPAPPEKLPEPSVSPPGAVPESSRSTHCGNGMEWNGMEGNGRGRDQDVELALERSVSAGDVDRVIEHYRSHHPKAQPGKVERTKIRDRLADGYSVADLCRAIDGCHLSPFNQGQNERGRRYDTLELIVRNSSQVQKFMEQSEQGAPPAVSERTLRNMRAMQNFLKEDDDAR